MDKKQGYNEGNDYMECRSFHLDIDLAWTATFSGECGKNNKKQSASGDKG